MVARSLRLTPARYVVGVERNLPVPMPDGAVLMADHYYPKAQGSFSNDDFLTFPTVLIRTPYGRGLEVPLPLGLINLFYSMRFAERGYHVLSQTVRGRYDSQGEFRPFVNERADGLATLEWITRQPWFNGSAAMWGPSYLGHAQWAVACSAPPYLKAIFPSVAGSSIDSIVYPDGAVGLDSVLRWVQVLDLIDTAEGWGGRAVWRQTRIGCNPRALRRADMHLPVIEAAGVALGKPVNGRFDWLLEMEQGQSGHSDLDEANFSDRVGDVTAHAHLLTGWYDIFQRQVLADYAALRAAGRNPYLTIGPWGHAAGGMASESLREGIAWFDAHLKGDKARLGEQSVRVYVMGATGASRWREMSAWPPPARERRLFLHSEGRFLPSPPGPSSPPDGYRYDPADPTPAVGGALIMPPYGPMDNRALEARPDVLCYTTPTLARDVEVIGPVRLELYASSTLEHTDFYGRLCDVQPDGRSINLCDGLFRVEPGKGERVERLPDGTMRLEISLWATANCFRRGHRIRLQVSSGAHPRWARNLGAGESMTTGTAMRPADQTVYHDSAHPSALVLPLVPLSR